MTRTCIINAETGVVENIVDMGVAALAEVEQRVEFVKGKKQITEVPRFVEEAPVGKILVASDVAQVGDVYRKNKWQHVPPVKIPEVEAVVLTKSELAAELAELSAKIEALPEDEK